MKILKYLCVFCLIFTIINPLNVYGVNADYTDYTQVIIQTTKEVLKKVEYNDTSVKRPPIRPKLNLIELEKNEPIFLDVGLNHPNRIAIEYLYENNIISGDGKGYFYPEYEIRFDDFLTMLVRAFLPGTEIPDDILEFCIEKDWVDPAFPYIVSTDVAKRGRVYKCLLKAKGVNVYTSDYSLDWEDYENTLIVKGLIDSYRDLQGGITRGETAELFYRVLKGNFFEEIVVTTEGIEIVNTTIFNTSIYVKALSKVPMEIINKFVELGWSICIDNGVFLGYYRESDIQAIGLCSYAKKTIFLKSAGSMLHEFGHFIDKEIDGKLGSDYFYNLEGEKFEEYIGYKLLNSKEYLAEYFERFILAQENNEDDFLNEITPKTFNYFMELQENNWNLSNIEVEV